MITPEAEDFLKKWDKGADLFTVISSGSTGEPKSVQLTREMMEWSARMTASFLKPLTNETIFCCLPMDKVGGMMMAVRARVWGLRFIATEPVSNPLKEKTDADIVSLTPHQLGNILDDPQAAGNLKRFQKVLIGGASIHPVLEKKIRSFSGNTRFWHTYGMTETCSHIAFRDITKDKTESHFTALPEVRVEKSDKNTALIFWPFSSSPLETTDIIDTFPEGSFVVLGRMDNIINSGGIKINPELIERLIMETLEPAGDFIISSIPDETLGEKLVMVCQHTVNCKISNVNDLKFLKEINPYWVPKEIKRIEKIPYNAGGKPDRLTVRKLVSGQ